MRSSIDSAAQLRGAFVGAAAGTVSIAAHALGGATAPPDQAAVALLIAACTLIGSLAGSLRTRHGVGEIMALLALGQALGHAALSVSAGHHHGNTLTTVMLAAHLLAIPAGALLIRGADLAVVRAVASVRQMILALDATAPIPDHPGLAIPATRVPVRLRTLVSSGIGRRGPPLPR